MPGQPGQLRLTVADTGPGIAAADPPHVFEPFYTTKPAGTGLGLAVSYGIVQDHHGTIEVHSTPGQGTVFVLTFPALEPARRTRLSPPVAAHATIRFSQAPVAPNRRAGRPACHRRQIAGHPRPGEATAPQPTSDSRP
jgi:hypothetical protein